MIVRMAKVEIAGLRGLLEPALALIRESGSLQIEPGAPGFVRDMDETCIHSFLPDGRTISERFFLDNLRRGINELLAGLPEEPLRTSYIEPACIMDTIAATLPRHLSALREMRSQKEALQRELNELLRYRAFLKVVAPLSADFEGDDRLDFVGVCVKDAAVVQKIETILERMTEGRYEIAAVEMGEEGTALLIIVEKKFSADVNKALGSESIREMRLPGRFESLALPEKLTCMDDRITELKTGTETINKRLEEMGLRWAPFYKRVKEWTEDRLSVMKAAASVLETGMCFFIYGWIPADEAPKLREKLDGAFKGEVTLTQKEMLEEDMMKAPVIIRNSAYFRPFELFTRILPLPKYESFDPTPLIGIFFPVFFGMILGDAGYGLLLAFAAFTVLRKSAGRRDLRDAAKILLISSFYTVIFGVLYGEFFGDLGHRLFGLVPALMDRRGSVLPMLYFAVAVGSAHISLGFILGFLTALKRKMKKEALSKLINMFTVLFIVVLCATFVGPFPDLIRKPVIIAILVLTPLLFFTGGLLAPLELLKSIGNIISYARIMAIGLTSVLLAFTANRLAGMTGDIVIGILVGVLLHALNLILGVFSPAIHSMRLHYVEFFSKFTEQGGRGFAPLKK